MQRILFFSIVLAVLLYSVQARSAGYYYYPVYTPTYNYAPQVIYYCKNQTSTPLDNISDEPHGYSSHGFTFEVDSENANDPFFVDAKNENLILGYEYLKRSYFGNYFAAGIRGVLAFDDYTDDAGIEIKSGTSVILEPMFGIHLSSASGYKVTHAPGSANSNGGYNCDYEYEGSKIFSNLFFVQPYYKSGSRDLNGWHVGYELMYEKYRGMGRTTENDREVNPSSDRMAIILKTGELDDYGKGGGVEFMFAFSNFNNLPSYRSSKLFMSIGFYDYENGSRLLFTIGGMN